MIQHKRVSPCPALLLSLPPSGPQLGPNWKPLFLLDLRSQFSPSSGGSSRFIQTMASGGPMAAPQIQTYQLTPSGAQAHPLRYTRDRGMLLSHTPKPSKVQEKANLEVGTHAQACKGASRHANGKILRILCLNNVRTQSPPDSQIRVAVHKVTLTF